MSDRVAELLQFYLAFGKEDTFVLLTILKQSILQLFKGINIFNCLFTVKSKQTNPRYTKYVLQQNCNERIL